jgi:hypothetical protein
MTEYYLVDVKSIKSDTPRSQFNVDELDKLAQSILESGGLLAPLLLKQTGPESYEVLAGDLEYYAAVRAKEIDPRKGEMVNAFVISPKEQESAVQQFALLNPPQETAPPGEHPPGPAPVTSSSSDADQRLTNLESRLDEAIREMKRSQDREVSRLEQEVKELKSQIPQKVEPLDGFNTFSLPQLAQKFASAGFRGKSAERVIQTIEKERNKAEFTSFTDIVERVDGLGDKRMISIIDAWAGLY